MEMTIVMVDMSSILLLLQDVLVFLLNNVLNQGVVVVELQFQRKTFLEEATEEEEMEVVVMAHMTEQVSLMFE